MSNTTTIRRNSNQQNRSFRNFMWISMLMSLAVVFFGMQLMMVGPLKGRLDSIQTRLDLSDQNMQQLVGVQDGVLETNSLLEDLQEQSGRLEEMRVTMGRISALRNRVESEARSTPDALKQLEHLASLQKQVVAEAAQTDAALAQIARLDSLRDTIIGGSEQTDVADNSLDGILALQKRVIAASNNYEKASVSIANLTDLTQRLIESNEDLQIASERFDSFIGLQNRLIATAESQEQADTAVRTLIAMKDTLAGDSIQLEAADRNLKEILTLQERLNGQSARVAEAIQNLELMDDFHTEVTQHVHSLSSLRRTLMELAMMETTIGRVASVIAPLTEISSLRRLSDREIREAARVIIDQRNSRLSREPSEGSAVMTAEADNADESDLVPLPPEARIGE